MTPNYARSRRRSVSKFGWIMSMLIGVALIIVLYSIKAKALAAKKEVRHLKAVLVQMQAEGKLLEAEKAHLQNPERIRKLAKEHLALEPVKAKRVLTFEQALQELPKKENGGAQ